MLRRLGSYFLVLECVDICMHVSDYHTYREPISRPTITFIFARVSIHSLDTEYIGVTNNIASSAIPTLSTIRKESFWFPQRELLSHCAEMGRQMSSISSMDATICSRAAIIVTITRRRVQLGGVKMM